MGFASNRKDGGIMAVELWTGVPGGGKTLSATKVIVKALKRGKHVLTNILINTGKIKKMTGVYEFRGFDKLNPLEFVKYSIDQGDSDEEGRFLIVIDESQVLINSRDFGARDRMSWVKFITNHRHLGYNVILITQYDRAIDKQIRNVVETIKHHKNLNRLGLFVFCPIKVFIQTEYFMTGSNQRLANGHSFFVVGSTKKYYDTHQTKKDIFLVFPEAKIYCEEREPIQLLSEPEAEGVREKGTPGPPAPEEKAV